MIDTPRTHALANEFWHEWRKAWRKAGEITFAQEAKIANRHVRKATALAILLERELSALRAKQSGAVPEVVPYLGLQDEIAALADKMRATYPGASMRGLRGINEWCMTAREKAMIESGLRTLAMLAAAPSPSKANT